MRPVFLFTLVLSGAAMIFFLIAGDYGWKGKLLAVGLFTVSLALIFIKTVHFLVPFVLQLTLCFWYAFDRHING